MVEINSIVKSLFCVISSYYEVSIRFFAIPLDSILSVYYAIDYKCKEINENIFKTNFIQYTLGPDLNQSDKRLSDKFDKWKLLINSLDGES